MRIDDYHAFSKTAYQFITELTFGKFQILEYSSIESI